MPEPVHKPTTAQPVAPPVVVTPPAPVLPPKMFTVLEHITPTTTRWPGAKMQYGAGAFYQADAFLLDLWSNGDPVVKPYDPPKA
jgi:hypothetical protein